MDIATILGFGAGIALVCITIFLSGPVSLYFDVPAMILVFGGTLAATLVNFPLGDVLRTFNTVRHAFLQRSATPEQLIRQLVEYAIIARREGILALERPAEASGDEFIKHSIQLAIDGTPPELLKEILVTELSSTESRHALGQSILLAMASFAPAFGLIGTLIGLVAMMATLDDPSQIGRGMAIALLTTLYGALLANLVFLPAAGKLRVRTGLELLRKEIVIEGILAIQSGDHPRIVEQKLKAYVSPTVRARIITGR